MTGQLSYLLAEERVADVQRPADHDQLVRSAKRLHPSGHGRPEARLETGAEFCAEPPEYGQFEVKS